MKRKMRPVRTGMQQLVTKDGETMSLAAWAGRLGVPYGTVRHRLFRGHSPRDALWPPVGTRRAFGVRVLVVGEDDAVLEALGGADVTVVDDVKGVRRWKRESSGAEASAAIVATDVLGARDAARFLAELAPGYPVALHGTGPLSPSLRRAARTYGRRCWPTDSREQLRRFLRFAAALHRCSDETISLAIADLATRGGLTPYLAQIMAMATTDATADDICDALGMSQNTLKTHVRTLLHATGTTNLDRLGKVVLRVALARTREPVLVAAGG